LRWGVRTPRAESWTVTYNFDPDRWYENERLRLDQRRRTGDLTEQALAKALEELDRRYEAMIERLDGTFPLPKPEKTTD
jgi:hypothetical protein